MIKKYSLLQELKMDLIKAEKCTLKGLIFELLFNINFQMLVSYRLQHRISKWPKPFKWLLLPLKLITEYLTSSQVHYDAQIEGGVKFDHCVGVVIGSGVQIKKGTRILQNVTLGTKRSGLLLFPKIGENVTIYAGAVVVGDIIIGNNCTIGANSVVLTNMPDNSLALGVPAKISLS